MWKGGINMESFAKIFIFIFLSLWITRALHESWMHKPLSSFTKEIPFESDLNGPLPKEFNLAFVLKCIAKKLN